MRTDSIEMRTLLIYGLVAAYLCQAASLSSFSETPSSNAALAVAVNRTNPATDVSPQMIRQMYLGDIREWPNRRRVTLVIRDGGSPALAGMLKQIVKMTSAEYHRFLIGLEFQGQQPLRLKTLNSTMAACEFLASVPGAVAIIEASSAAACADQIKILSVGGKTPGEPGYLLQ